MKDKSGSKHKSSIPHHGASATPRPERLNRVLPAPARPTPSARHLTEAELLCAAGGDPDVTLSETAAAHLEECPECSGKASAASEAIEMLCSHKVPEMPTGLADRLCDAHSHDIPSASSIPEEATDGLIMREQEVFGNDRAANAPHIAGQSPRIDAPRGDGGEIMTPEDLAAFLRIPMDTVYEILPDLPHLNLAGQIRFRRSSILEWLDASERNSRRRGGPRLCESDFSPRLWREGP